jgi:hypothetical protein
MAIGEIQMKEHMATTFVHGPRPLFTGHKKDRNFGLTVQHCNSNIPGVCVDAVRWLPGGRAGAA